MKIVSRVAERASVPLYSGRVCAILYLYKDAESAEPTTSQESRDPSLPRWLARSARTQPMDIDNRTEGLKMKASIRVLSYLALACLVLGAASVSFAQSTTGSLSGLVTAKEDGAALPGAQVTAVHQPTGTQYTAVTGADGRLPIISYFSGSISSDSRCVSMACGLAAFANPTWLSEI